MSSACAGEARGEGGGGAERHQEWPALIPHAYCCSCGPTPSNDAWPAWVFRRGRRMRKAAWPCSRPHPHPGAGTAEWMSPEMCRCEPYTEKADVYR